METSKRITYILIIFFLLAIISVGIVRVKFDIDITNLLNYIMPLTTSCTLAYFGKASLENVTKIKTGSTSGIQVDANGTSIQVEPTVINNTIDTITSGIEAVTSTENTR